jgi:hypothetical protein
VSARGCKFSGEVSARHRARRGSLRSARARSLEQNYLRAASQLPHRSKPTIVGHPRLAWPSARLVIVSVAAARERERECGAANKGKPTALIAVGIIV